LFLSFKIGAINIEARIAASVGELDEVMPVFQPALDVPHGGVLCAVSSTHKISVDEFDRMLAEGAARAKCNLRIVERPCLPPDFCVAPGFPEGNYLKFVIAVKE